MLLSHHGTACFFPTDTIPSVTPERIRGSGRLDTCAQGAFWDEDQRYLSALLSYRALLVHQLNLATPGQDCQADTSAEKGLVTTAALLLPAAWLCLSWDSGAVTVSCQECSCTRHTPLLLQFQFYFKPSCQQNPSMWLLCLHKVTTWIEVVL